MNLALLRHGSLKCLILIENCLFSVAHRDKKVLLMSFLLFSALTNTTSMKSFPEANFTFIFLHFCLKSHPNSAKVAPQL